jgi:hypothetical protein
MGCAMGYTGAGKINLNKLLSRKKRVAESFDGLAVCVVGYFINMDVE